MTTYLGNALSLGMLDLPVTTLLCRRISVDEVREILTGTANWSSCVGHADTSALLSQLLGFEVPLRRVSTSLVTGDKIIVAQYNGPRLPEGAKSLPEGASLRWYCVEVSTPE